MKPGMGRSVMRPAGPVGTPARFAAPTPARRTKKLATQSVITIATLALTFGLPFALPACADLDGKFPGKGSKAKWIEASKVFNKGIDLLNSGNFDGAIEKFNLAISKYPHDDNFYFSAAVAYFKKGDWNTAEKFDRKAYNISPSRFETNYGLAVSLYRLDRISEALPLLVKSEKLARTSDQKRDTSYYLSRVRQLLMKKSK